MLTESRSDPDFHPALVALPAENYSSPALTRVSRRGNFPLKATVAALDSLAVVVAMGLALLVRTGFPHGPDGAARTREHLTLIALSMPIWVILFSRYRLYRRPHVARRAEEFGRVIHAVGASSLAIAVLAFVLKIDASRGWLVLTFGLGIVIVVLERSVIRAVLNALRRRGRLMRSAVIVGGNVEALAICAMLEEDLTLGYRVVGFVDDEVPKGTYLYDHRPVLGAVRDVAQAAKEAGATDVILATTSIDLEASNLVIRKLGEQGVHVRLSCSLRDVAEERLSVSALGRFPTVAVEPVRHGWRVGAKRALDVAVAATTLAVLSPVMALVMLAIKLDSRGPVLFRQFRVGRNGRLFKILKLRTMVADAEDQVFDLRELNEADGPLFKMRYDPRITRVGRLLRRWSIDEVPQLVNVLRGDMSLVGPRPAIPAEMAGWAPDLYSRLRVKPGVTGMWQVSGRRNRSFDDYARLDLFYVDNWSLWSDLAILAKTLPTVLRGQGAC